MRVLPLIAVVGLSVSVVAQTQQARLVPGAQIRPLLDGFAEVARNGTVEQFAPQFDSAFKSAVRWLQQARIPDQVPLTLVRSLQTDLTLLTTTTATRKRRELAVEDVIWKGEYCNTHPSEGLGAAVAVSVRTLANNAESRGWEVVFKTAPEMEDKSIPPIPFPSYSSPTSDNLPAGRYVFWTRDPKDVNRTGKERELPIRQPAAPIDLTVPQ
jgi:hypothetical protein